MNLHSLTPIGGRTLLCGLFISALNLAPAMAEELTPLQLWRLAAFDEITGTGDAADNADPDGDGIANLIEYSLGTSPVTANLQTFEATPGTDYWTFTFARQPARNDVTLTLKQSTDLQNWTPVARSVNGGAFTSLVTEAETFETTSLPVVDTTVTYDVTGLSRCYFCLVAETTVE